MRQLPDTYLLRRCMFDGLDLSAWHQLTLDVWPGRGPVRLGRVMPDDQMDGRAVVGTFDSVAALVIRDHGTSTVAVLGSPTVTSLQRLEAELTSGEHSRGAVNPTAARVSAGRTYRPEHIRGAAARSSSRAKRLSMSWPEVRAAVLASDGCNCYRCGRRPPRSIPVRSGDDRSSANPRRSPLRLQPGQDRSRMAPCPPGSDDRARPRRGTPPHAARGQRNVLHKVTATGLRVRSDLDR